MSDEKKILRSVDHTPGDGHADYMFWCPGCQCGHGVWVTPGKNVLPGAVWGFNGNMDKPTFTPSILTLSNEWTPPVTTENMAQWKDKPWPQTKVSRACHLFVKDGNIQYLGDCMHALAGKTIPMEAF